MAVSASGDEMIYYCVMHFTRPLFRLLSAFLLATGWSGLADAETLTTVSSVRALTDEDYAHGNTFCLTGLVIRSARKGCFLETKDGNCCLWSTNLSFREGQVIRANGYTALDFFADDPILHTTNAVILGERTLPDPQLLSLQDIEHTRATW